MAPVKGPYQRFNLSPHQTENEDSGEGMHTGKPREPLAGMELMDEVSNFCPDAQAGRLRGSCNQHKVTPGKVESGGFLTLMQP